MAVRGQQDHQQELAAAQARAEALEGELRSAQEKIAWLEARLEELLRTVFGRKSERAPRAPEEGAGDGSGDDAAPAGRQAEAGQGADEAREGDNPGDDSPPAGGGRNDRKKRARKRGRKPGTSNPGRVDHSHLPVRDELLDLPEAERCCPSCGTAYVRSGTKDSWIYEIDWQAVARRIRRQQYRPACSCGEAGSVLAPPAPRLGERTQLGTSVWGWFLVQVFGQFRAQSAAARDLEALGLRVPVSTLSQGLRRMAGLFEPIDRAIARRQAEAAVAQADETSWPVQYIEGQDNPKEVSQGGGKPLYWLWTCLTADTVRMRILPTRGAPSGEQLLGNLVGTDTDREVIVVCDRWGAYKSLASHSSGRIVLQYCWSHQRRDFRKAGTGFPELQSWSEDWMERIGTVFHLAKLRRQAWKPDLPLDGQEPTFRQRQKELEAAFEALFQRAREEMVMVCSQGILEYNRSHPDGRKVAWLEAQSAPLRSLVRHREGLGVFLRNPRVPLDNNACERIVRGPVIARCTSFGSGGPQAARSTGLLFGVLATVRLNGLNPYTWVLDYLAACARNRGEPPQDLDPWLPWRMDEQRQQALRRPPVSWRATSPSPTPAPSDEPPTALPLAA